jgi:hypothetical protein
VIAEFFSDEENSDTVKKIAVYTSKEKRYQKGTYSQKCDGGKLWAHRWCMEDIVHEIEPREN